MEWLFTTFHDETFQSARVWTLDKVRDENGLSETSRFVCEAFSEVHSSEFEQFDWHGISNVSIYSETADVFYEQQYDDQAGGHRYSEIATYIFDNGYSTDVYVITSAKGEPTVATVNGEPGNWSGEINHVNPDRTPIYWEFPGRVFELASDPGPPVLGTPGVPGALSGADFTPPSVVDEVCLPGWQEVRLADGASKTVLNLEIGDVVEVPDQDDPEGPKKICRIVEVYQNEPQPILTLKFRTDDGEEFDVASTPGHRYYVRNLDWRHASDIPLGAECRTADDRWAVLLSTELDPNPVPVYNFQVEGAHTYFVGSSRKCSVLTHNQDCGNTWNTQDPSSVKKMMREEGLGFTDKMVADRDDLRQKFIEVETRVTTEIGKEIAIGKITKAAGGLFNIFSWFRQGKKDVKAVAAAADAVRHADDVADAVKNITHFPTDPRKFSPQGLVRKEYKNGEIIKWIDPKTSKAKYEWNADAAGGHYHMTPDEKNRIPHPDINDTHIPPGTILPK